MKHADVFTRASAVAFLAAMLVGGTARGADDAKPPKPPKSTPALLEIGKKIYEVNCLACHGAAGDGEGPVGKVLNPKPRNFGKDPFKQGVKPEAVFASVTGGVKNTAMVGWAQLSDNDRWAVTYYVLTMVPKPDPKRNTPSKQTTGEGAAKAEAEKSEAASSK